MTYTDVLMGMSKAHLVMHCQDNKLAAEELQAKHAALKAENELLTAGDIGKWRTGYRKEINDLLLVRDALKAELAEEIQQYEDCREQLISVCRELDALKAQEPVEYKVGRLYERLDGVVVRIVGTGNETVFDEEGCHYYNRTGDRGRVTGTAHDYSYPKNLVRLFTAPQPAVPAGWKLVPIEPTQPMGFAANSRANELVSRPKGFWYWRELYAAMLSAAPAYSQQDKKLDASDYCLLEAAAKSGDKGAMELAAQLAGVPPCSACGYRKEYCRCEAPQDKDGERLDYLQERGATVYIHLNGHTPLFEIGGMRSTLDADIRAAIDQAMKES